MRRAKRYHPRVRLRRKYGCHLCGRARLQPLVVGGHEAGGQLSLTSLVENFPGFPQGIAGPELVEKMKQQAEHFGAEYLHGSVAEGDFCSGLSALLRRRLA